MKTFKVKTNAKTYHVNALDAEKAVEIVKRITDEASQLQTVNALIEDEKAAVQAYDVAIENLRGNIPEESLQAIIAIRDDENRHIENLQAVLNGTVTKKNLEDMMVKTSNAAKIQHQLNSHGFNITVALEDDDNAGEFMMYKVPRLNKSQREYLINTFGPEVRDIRGVKRGWYLARYSGLVIFAK